MTRQSAATSNHDTSARRVSRSALFGSVRLTHAERKVYSEGYSKGDVARYYAAVMPQFLPQIAGRPLSIVRCPQGVTGQCFFQKHMTPALKLVHSVQIQEQSGSSDSYLYVTSADEVFELVQVNALEFHPWAATIDDLDRTDYLVFDLDPGPGITWLQVVAAARLLCERLSNEGLTSFARTSGGKGLHVVVPLHPPEPWDVAREFARAFAESIAGSKPQQFIAMAAKEGRRDRIFIDYLRNARGATSIASYSLRARPGALVATPLRWSELYGLKSASKFTLRSVPARLRSQTGTPWPRFESVRQNVDESTPE